MISRRSEPEWTSYAASASSRCAVKPMSSQVKMVYGRAHPQQEKDPMVPDTRIIAVWDRASAPISRYLDLIEALGTGGDEREIVRGFRSLDKEFSSVGIRSENPALYRPSRPIALWLVTAMIDDLAARTGVAAGRLGEAVREIRRRLDDLNARSARFAKVGSDQN